MTTEGNNQKLGDYIKTRRLARELDIPTAAELAELNGSYWRKLEAGKYFTPAPRFLQAISRVLGCPLEDLYSLAGYTPIEALPTLSPYLRTKYPGLPPEAVADLQKWFELQRAYYDIPADQPVYPPLSKDKTTSSKRSKPSATGRNRADHPWRAA